MPTERWNFELGSNVSGDKLISSRAETQGLQVTVLSVAIGEE